MHPFLRTALATGVLLCFVVPASALDFSVGSNGDEGDANPGDGFCATPGFISVCTFRAAVEESNWFPGEDRIFLGVGTVTISGHGIRIEDDVIIQGAGAYQSILQGDPLDTLDEGLVIGNHSKVSISDLALRGFDAGARSLPAGAALVTTPDDGNDVTLVRVWIDWNSSMNCAGVWIDGGVAEIRDSTFTHNRARGNADMPSSSLPGLGGALCITAGADVTVTNSTFFGNSAIEGGAIGMAGLGSRLRLISSTLVDNIDLAPSTSSASDHDDSAIYQTEDTFLYLNKTLIAGSCHPYSAGLTSHGGNIQSPDDSCLLNVAGDQPNLARHELGLGPIGNYGGPVPTMLPSSTSPAVEPPLSLAGPPCPTLDARGMPRFGRCDVGAVERQTVDHEVPIFVDGFETGNTNAWSSTSPP
ncbi:MAG: hypothetical protein MPN21_11660 [Thermoanaerobaculia bacterium]|nr:hypothetical protein [Thermoanaerobaculia bacterium]